jgi:uncharacterized membrane protein
MERWFAQLASSVALGLELLSVLLIGWGALMALSSLARRSLRTTPDVRSESVFLTLGRYVLLGLEFTLAADVVRTAIAPSWDDIGKLGAIAVIRTFLNFFLERDIDLAKSQEQEAARAATREAAGSSG